MIVSPYPDIDTSVQVRTGSSDSTLHHRLWDSFDRNGVCSKLGFGMRSAIPARSCRGRNVAWNRLLPLAMVSEEGVGIQAGHVSR